MRRPTPSSLATTALPSDDDLFDQHALSLAPIARLRLGMTLYEQIDNALDAVDFGLSLGLRSGSGSLFDGGWVLPAGNVAKGLLRSLACRCEVDRRIWANR